MLQQEKLNANSPVWFFTGFSLQYIYRAMDTYKIMIVQSRSLAPVAVFGKSSHFQT